eukprot:UN26689
MVMERLGDSLSDCFKLCDKKFSLQTVLSITIALIRIIQALHNAGLLHRDIKLQNFLTGYEDSTIIKACDFGLNDFWRDPKGNHIPLTK